MEKNKKNSIIAKRNIFFLWIITKKNFFSIFFKITELF